MSHIDDEVDDLRRTVKISRVTETILDSVFQRRRWPIAQRIAAKHHLDRAIRDMLQELRS